jgi:hypothetical protein
MSELEGRERVLSLSADMLVVSSIFSETEQSRKTPCNHMGNNWYCGGFDMRTRGQFESIFPAPV